ncbi:hypothetical protein I8748_08450 [Nostoc sp. CENA67]|uniref:Transporter n=1 Tax=Amazonocrinis nigriterrae CENA67 TaxID=2794033 RepID=A0A8J7L6E4_9NOST|nr:hypothetical protein [Amazonocrinis nigriterrae]MBH8562204.1 hypothetical protein [Amazonocrinis nigriterrae CENA67]
MRKTTLLTLTLSLLVVLPATAQLGNVWTDFKSYSTDLQNYLSNNLSETLKPLELQTQSNITGANGDLNIPNPVAAGQQIQDYINNYSVSDKFENNPSLKARSVNNELNRLLTRGVVTGVLGTDAQNRTKTKLENTEEVLKSISETSNENNNIIEQFINQAKQATNLNNPQFSGILSLLTVNQQTVRIQQEQVKIVAETYAQTLQTNQSLQYSNLNLANISQQMEESNRARRVDASTEAARLLRTTAQIDLFGRKLEN